MLSERNAENRSEKEEEQAGRAGASPWGYRNNLQKGGKWQFWPRWEDTSEQGELLEDRKPEDRCTEGKKRNVGGADSSKVEVALGKEDKRKRKRRRRQKSTGNREEKKEEESSRVWLGASGVELLIFSVIGPHSGELCM
eukprot:Gb_08800 [translate_table: standard]